MKVLSFENHEDLAEFMIQIALQKQTVCAILFYEDTCKLLKELASFEGISLNTITLSDPEYKGYNKEYYIFLDDNLIVNVDEAWHGKNEWHDEGYFSFGGYETVAFIHGNASSQILKAIEGSTCFEIEIGEESEYDFDDYVLEDDEEEQLCAVSIYDLIKQICEKLFEE